MRISQLMRPLANYTTVFVLLFVGGCAIFTPEPPPEAEVPVQQPEPEPVVPLPPPPQPEPEPPVVKLPPPEPEVIPPAVFVPPVAIVLSGNEPAYTVVADELKKVLENYSTFDLSDTTLSVGQVYQRIAEQGATAVVAIGLRAAKSAKSFAPVPVVFCQVFNVGDNDLVSAQSKGVSSIPPIELQLTAWREIDPGLDSIGAILGSGHEGLIAETEAAADRLGIDSHIRTAASDKETMYVFNRLTKEIDGFLLFPDNRVLSRSVLQEMLTTAARRGVQIAVFNDALLSMGATISTSAVATDIATSVVQVLDRFEFDNAESLPGLSALSEIELRTNKAMVRKFGLELADSAQADAGTSTL